ncbi:XRE family transcriptional regulator [Clostridioides difficile]|nr:XRE family transcriptional regulator [Clostridioides difficile]MDK3179884.1 XRE family transcriptional regulator [Clostridioides difficile]HBF0844884.1 XRE family transcriptional regulator [Clostridioides difficile]
MSNLSKRLKELRLKRGLTQEQVANDLGTTKVSIGRYENGTREPKSEMLESMSNYYDVSIDYLFGKTDIENYNEIKQPNNSLIGKRIKLLRTEKNIVQKELADKLQINIDTLSKYENNLASPKSDDIVKLANYFDVTTDYLLGTTLVRNHIDTVAAHKANPHKDLPEEAQEQLNDYIEFLMNKYKK